MKNGTGVFDVLMRAVSQHINEQQERQIISGNDYATVYLGGLQATLNTALEFLLRSRREGLEAMLLQQQIILAEVEVEKAQAEKLRIEAEVLLAGAQVDKVRAEIILIEKQQLKIPAEVALLEQQKLNLEDELLTNIKERLKLDDDRLTAAKQRERLDQEIENLQVQQTQITNQAALLAQQTLTEVETTKVTIAQECKLRAEFDRIQADTLKTNEEISLLVQKVATERAQIDGSAVSGNSVIGKQMALYQAQTDGFTKDAVVKAAKLFVDSWNVRRTTDTATIANATNGLDDASVGQMTAKVKASV